MFQALLNEFQTELQIQTNEEEKVETLRQNIKFGLSEYYTWFNEMNKVYDDAKNLQGNHSDVVVSLQKLDVIGGYCISLQYTTL